MKKFVRTFFSAAVLGCGAVFTWNYLLDEKAKQSVKTAAGKSAALADHFISSYMGTEAHTSTAEQREQNKQWVTEQWKEAGY